MRELRGSARIRIVDYDLSGVNLAKSHRYLLKKAEWVTPARIISSQANENSPGRPFASMAASLVSIERLLPPQQRFLCHIFVFLDQ
jgi:hypothetical protein